MRLTPPAAGTCDDEGIEIASSTRTLSTVSTVRFVVGLAAGGAGAWLLLSEPASGARPGAAMGATAFAGGAGVAPRGWVP